MPTYVPEDEGPAPQSSTAGVEIADTSASASKQQLVLLAILLSLYCVPIVLSSIFGFYYAIKIPSFKFDTTRPFPMMMIEISTNLDRYTGMINSIIMPVAAAITAANYDKFEKRQWGWALFLIPLAGLIASFFNVIIFDLSLPANKTVANMFQTTASALSVYVMMLVGLRAINSSGS